MQNSDNNWMRQLAKSGSASPQGAADERFEVDCNAEELGRHFISLKTRFDRISRFVPETQAKIRQLNIKLNGGNLRPSEAKRLRHELEEHHSLLKDAVREQINYAKLAKAAAADAFGATFLEVARLKLDIPTFQALFTETRTMLGRRPAAGVVVPRAPESHSQPDRKRRGRRMHPDEAEVLRAGRIRAGGGTMVWSDERDLDTEVVQRTP
ncbi:hypothetical protein JQ597_04550 [Bradyrhizobium sp. AUGA SZCCT0177]|uniref:hypothetical protein n=1 Tax=Bradyrhizobium sp. AUGA SZCCT0177 TaxID=2807665 RepID=UPI001BAA3A42|nr:hypothetical protein [Bradyrhizobium sp. AUGA SZCCT0177]MBR1281305.1 hypothetical protein [Bradyrhizobium sp. AUGA SZCCT0177]